MDRLADEPELAGHRRVHGPSLPARIRPTLPRMALPPPGPDRTALVTGASSGIGAEIARQLAAPRPRRHPRRSPGGAPPHPRRRAGRSPRRAGRGHRAPTSPTRRRATPSRSRSPTAASSSTSSSTTRGCPRWARSTAVTLVARSRCCASTSKRWPTSAARSCPGWWSGAAARCSTSLPRPPSSRCPVRRATRRQGVRPRLHPGAGPGAQGHRGDRHHALPRPGEDRASAPPPASPTTRPKSSLPKFMWVSADAVAKAAVDGMAKGRTKVIPGASNRFLANLSRHAPRGLLLPMLASQHPALEGVSEGVIRRVGISRPVGGRRRSARGAPRWRPGRP